VKDESPRRSKEESLLSGYGKVAKEVEVPDGLTADPSRFRQAIARGVFSMVVGLWRLKRKGKGKEHMEEAYYPQKGAVSRPGPQPRVILFRQGVERKFTRGER